MPRADGAVLRIIGLIGTAPLGGRAVPTRCRSDRASSRPAWDNPSRSAPFYTVTVGDGVRRPLAQAGVVDRGVLRDTVLPV